MAKKTTKKSPGLAPGSPLNGRNSIDDDGFEALEQSIEAKNGERLVELATSASIPSKPDKASRCQCGHYAILHAELTGKCTGNFYDIGNTLHPRHCTCTHFDEKGTTPSPDDGIRPEIRGITIHAFDGGDYEIRRDGGTVTVITRRDGLLYELANTLYLARSPAGNSCKIYCLNCGDGTTIDPGRLIKEGDRLVCPACRGNQFGLKVT